MPPFSEFLQYGALGLVALILVGLYKLAQPIATAHVGALDSASKAFAALTTWLAQHEEKDQARHGVLRDDVADTGKAVATRVKEAEERIANIVSGTRPRLGSRPDR